MELLRSHCTAAIRGLFGSRSSSAVGSVLTRFCCRAGKPRAPSSLPSGIAVREDSAGGTDTLSVEQLLLPRCFLLSSCAEVCPAHSLGREFFLRALLTDWHINSLCALLTAWILNSLSRREFPLRKFRELRTVAVSPSGSSLPFPIHPTTKGRRIQG